MNARLLSVLVSRYPKLAAYLNARARYLAHANGTDYKTYDYFLQQVENMVQHVYDGQLGGEFIDLMANLISGQIRQAVNQAWQDEMDAGALPDYLENYIQDVVTNQYSFVDGYYRDIVDARVDQTPITSLLARAPLWAQRWTEAYNEAVRLITAEMGGNMVWELGATEQHCTTCAALNGIVARASEWEELQVRPQHAPNHLLECEGWQCDCSLTPTDRRRSPKAFDTILNIVSQ